MVAIRFRSAALFQLGRIPGPLAIGSILSNEWTLHPVRFSCLTQGKGYIRCVDHLRKGNL